jgi:hypothetical protein
MTFELLLRVVISALAAYRVARMLALETGPFALFSRWRGWVFIWQGSGHGNKKTWITEGIECPLCTGFWASLVMLGLTYVDYVVYAVVWLAVAGLQTAIQRQERD